MCHLSSRDFNKDLFASKIAPTMQREKSVWEDDSFCVPFGATIIKRHCRVRFCAHAKATATLYAIASNLSATQALEMGTKIELNFAKTTPEFAVKWISRPEVRRFVRRRPEYHLHLHRQQNLDLHLHCCGFQWSAAGRLGAPSATPTHWNEPDNLERSCCLLPVACFLFAESRQAEPSGRALQQTNKQTDCLYVYVSLVCVGEAQNNGHSSELAPRRTALSGLLGATLPTRLDLTAACVCRRLNLAASA